MPTQRDLRYARAESTERYPQTIGIRCPKCRHVGVFTPLSLPNSERATSWDVWAKSNEDQWVLLGFRVCPNSACELIVFVIIDQQSCLLASYPAERIDFDASKLPEAVLAALEEAVMCHANQCYKAAAMMVRKTLEELCHDRGATGANLQQKIASLKTKVILPPDLLEVLDELRLLGNDAAHVAAKEYDTIGPDQLELAIDFTKEVLKAVYQYADLKQRFAALKQPVAGSGS